jgi:hypothetical protein
VKSSTDSPREATTRSTSISVSTRSFACTVSLANVLVSTITYWRTSVSGRTTTAMASVALL